MGPRCACAALRSGAAPPAGAPRPPRRAVHGGPAPPPRRGIAEGRAAAASQGERPEGSTWCRLQRGGAVTCTSRLLLPSEQRGWRERGWRRSSPPPSEGAERSEGKGGCRRGAGFRRGRAWGGDIAEGCSARYLWKEEAGGRRRAGAERPGAAAGNFVVLRACGSGFRSLPLSFFHFFSQGGRLRVFAAAVARAGFLPRGGRGPAPGRGPGCAGKRRSAGLDALPTLRGAEVPAAARGLRLPGF